MAQVGVRPPTFAVVTNRPEGVHFSYERYLVNRLRERFGFEGTPLRLLWRGKRRRDAAMPGHGGQRPRVG